VHGFVVLFVHICVYGIEIYANTHTKYIDKLIVDNCQYQLAQMDRHDVLPQRHWVLLMRQHWAIRDTDEKTRNVFSVFGCDCMVGTISGKSLKLLPPDVIF